MKGNQRLIALAGILAVAISLGIFVFGSPLVYQQFPGSPCNSPNNCDVIVSLYLIDNASAPPYNVTSDDLNGSAPLARLLDAFSNPGAYPTCRKLSSQTLQFGMNRNDAEVLQGFLNSVGTHTVRYKENVFDITMAAI